MNTTLVSTPTPVRVPTVRNFDFQSVNRFRRFFTAADLLAFMATYCKGSYEPFKVTGTVETGFLVEAM